MQADRRQVTEHAVVIAGGGPTGLMLAAELALAGADVALVERRISQELAGSRAGGLHSRTLEVLFDLGAGGLYTRLHLGTGHMGVVAGGVALATIATIFLVELIAALLSPSYIASRKAATSSLPDVQVFGSNWDPLSAVTWGVPTAVLVLAIFMLLRSKRDGGAEAHAI